MMTPEERQVAHELHLLSGSQRPHYLIQVDAEKLATFLGALPPQTLVRIEAGEIPRLLNLVWALERQHAIEPAGEMTVASAIPPQYSTSAPALAPITPPAS